MAETKAPQIIMQETMGYHNENLDATISRLHRGGSWKKQRVVVIIPASETIPAKVVLSYLNLAYPPNNGVARILCLGEEVGEAYSNAISSVLAHPELSQYEFILTIEHDNMPQGDSLLKLIECMEEHPEMSAIGGLYYTKGMGGVAQIWGDPSSGEALNFRPQIPDKNGGLVECCGIANGFSLFRTSMFKDEKLRRPWFKTQTVGGVSTQDLYFWADARKHGFRCGILSSVKIGHYDLRGDFGIPDFVW